MSGSGNVWMFHRVRVDGNQISEIYQARGMLHTYGEIAQLMDSALAQGRVFGSIAQALTDKNVIHLTFDDGYQEHLTVAKKLKKQYNLAWECATFAVNVRNVFYPKKLSMDLVYQLIERGQWHALQAIIGEEMTDINAMKSALFGTTNYIDALNLLCAQSPNYFLTEAELLELSTLFSIASHAINHCYLTRLNAAEIEYELQTSKDFLTQKLTLAIPTICYPEGDNNHTIRRIAAQCGYQYGLSIEEGAGNYAIGRTIPRVPNAAKSQ